MSWQHIRGFYNGDPDVRLIIEDFVYKSGGIIPDLTYMESAVAMLKSIGQWDNLATWVSPNFGVKLNGSNEIEGVACLKLKHQYPDSPAKAVYTTNVINQKAAYHAEPDKYLRATANIGISGDQTRHEFLLFRQNAPLVNANIMGWSRGIGARGMDTLLHSGKVALHSIGPDTISNSPSYAIDTWTLFEREYTGTNSIASTQGGTRLSAAIALDTIDAPLRFGRGEYDDDDDYIYLDAHITDAPIFKVGLSDANRNAVLDFLTTQYNL